MLQGTYFKKFFSEVMILRKSGGRVSTLEAEHCRLEIRYDSTALYAVLTHAKSVVRGQRFLNECGLEVWKEKTSFRCHLTTVQNSLLVTSKLDINLKN
ncbi:hypothetical protein AVEN_263632-1 [Araneus ventricosus]|uniref:Uncharacterized protein n=1 Tax=Araneus ventricosus TaxID=182803 RepID=A0A4Y2ARX5_ARAVE|nr:hypothetical protein AVEN_263632-1 [Araneus ventricosus]